MSNKASRASSKQAAATADRQGGTALRLVLGLFFAAFAAVMSYMLVYEHITGNAIPGCGEDSACAQLAEGFAGKLEIGSFEWPTAFIGLAYFVGLMAAWALARGTLPTSFRYLVRLGALGSLALCIIIFVKWMFCPYCLAAHAGNYALWITMELGRGRSARAAPAWIGMVLAFALASGGIGAWNHTQRAALIEKGEQELTEDLATIIERSQRDLPAIPEPLTTQQAADTDTTPVPEPAADTPATKPGPGATTESPPEQPTGDPPAGPAPATQATDAEPEQPGGEPFTGRYRQGPENAPIRMVMYTSYQCRDCRRVEHDVRKLMQQRDDLSVSIKYFPFNKECNPHVSRTSQPNACWAARAAEAAGILWGSDGFWKMHVWLFDHSGVFQTTEEIEQAIRGFGYDPQGFVKVMAGDKTLERVQHDCQEGHEFGLHFTPMIFINGVELRGWYMPNAVPRAVAQLAEQNLPPTSPVHDWPVTAFDKYVTDWREEPPRELPADALPRTLGPDDAPLQVMLWGDYQEEGSAKADAVIRRFLTGRDDVHYTFRHYPFDSDCNSNIKTRRHPLACRASQAAEAAGRLGGEASYWLMHAWLMENRERFSDETLGAAATEMGLDADALLAEMGSDAVQDAITDDIAAGEKLPRLRLGVRPGLYSIPTIFVDGRYVPRWRLEGHPVLETILQQAADGE